MNLRKKKQFNYQNIEHLSKNYEYESLTKGKTKEKIDIPISAQNDISDEKNYTLIFSQIMDSIRKNLGEEKRTTSFQEQQDDPQTQKIERRIKKKIKKQKQQVHKIKRGEQHEGQSNQFNMKQIENKREEQRRVDRVFSISSMEIQNPIIPESVIPRKHLNYNQIQSKSPLLQIQKRMKQGLVNTQYCPNIMNQYLNKQEINLSNFEQNKMKENGSKLFNRSSYHIGIAYYIHFKKTQFYSDPLEVDPTYHSKKLQKLHYQSN